MSNVPKGWRSALLSDVAEIKGGLAKGKDRAGVALRTVPYLRVANVQQRYLDLSEVSEIKATESEICDLALEQGDVLLNEGGDRDKLGRGWVWEGQIPLCIHQNHVFRARPKANLVDPYYLSYWANTEQARNYFIKTGKQTTNLASISKSNLSNLPVPLPPLPEQRRIAAILDQAEALRAKRRAALAKLDTLAQSIFIEMFGDPSVNPRNWPQVTMASLFQTPPIFGTMIPPAVDGGDWLSLRVANIQEWKLDLSDRKNVQLPASMIKRHSVSDGDLLMARAIASQDHLGKCVVAYPGSQKWAFDSHLMRLRFDLNKAEPEFIRSFLRTPGGRQIFLKASRRSAVQFNINTKEIAALKIPAPPVALQREFVSRVCTLDGLRESDMSSLALLDALFVSLQYRAFRGEL